MISEYPAQDTLTSTAELLAISCRPCQSSRSRLHLEVVYNPPNQYTCATFDPLTLQRRASPRSRRTGNSSAKPSPCRSRFLRASSPPLRPSSSTFSIICPRWAWSPPRVSAWSRARESRTGYSQYGPGCFVNAVGLTNPGAHVSRESLAALKVPADRFLLTSIFGGSIEEFVAVAKDPRAGLGRPGAETVPARTPKATAWRWARTRDWCGTSLPRSKRWSISR